MKKDRFGRRVLSHCLSIFLFLILAGLFIVPCHALTAAEAEPNGMLGTANPLPVNGETTGEFNTAGDADWYSITFASPGRVKLSFFAPADIRSRIELFNRNADYIWVYSYAINAGDDVFLSYDVVEPGTYFVRVYDQDGHASSNSYTLRSEFQPVIDGQEPNNEPGRAFLLNSRAVTGYIFSRGDEDWFKIFVNSGDKLTVTVTAPPEMSTYIELFDPNIGYLWVRNGAVNPGDKVSLEYTPTVSGYYYIKLTDQRGLAHPTAYTMAISGGNPGYIPSQTPITAESETNDQVSLANLIDVGTSVAGKIASVGDQDWYRLHFSKRGQWTVTLKQVPAALQMRVHLYNSSAGPVAYGQATDPGKLFSVTYDVSSPGEYYLMFSNIDGNVVSTETYQFETAFVEVNDPYEPNNDYGDAKPLTQLNRVEAYLFPAGDDDWYQVTVANPGELRMILSNLPQNITPEINVFNLSKEYVAGRSGTSGLDLELVYPVANPGVYLIRIRDQGGNDESVKPYTLTVNGAVFAAFAPVARIDQIAPGSIVVGDTVTFKGSGTDADGTIAGYNWRSSIQGALSNQAEFAAGNLVLGTHTIYFKVQDNSGIWSTEVSEVVYVGSSVTDEIEPNSPIGAANEVALDRPVKAKINQAGDEDYFKIYIDRPGRITATATNVPANLRIYLEYFNRNLDYLWTRQGAATQGDSVSVSLDVTEKGWYYLRVSDMDGHFNADFTYTLTVKPAFAVDPQEPNDGFINAYLLTGNDVQGYLFPRGDEDWYKVWVDKDGVLTVNLTSPSDIRGYVELFDRNRNYMWVRKAANNAGDAIQLVSPPFTEAGFVYIKISDADGNMNEMQMYQLSVSGARPGYIPAEAPLTAEAESNNVIADANLITFDAPVTATIGAPYDGDWFKFILPTPGIIHTRLADVPANLRMRVRLFRDDAGQIDYREATNSGDGLNLDTRITTPGVYYVLIDAPSQNESSTQPYRLTLSLRAAADDFEPNDRFGDAAVLKDRNRIQALIFDRGDEDWYRVVSDAGSVLAVTVADVPAEIRPQIDIFDINLNHLASKFATNRGQGLTLSLDISQTSDYFIRIKDVTNEGFSTDFYSLIITGARFNSYVPLAFIDSISPNPAISGAGVTLQGHGEDKDGSIIGYEWRSSLVDNPISNDRVPTLSNLPKGVHTISFKVKDNDQNWSSPTSQLLYVGVSAPQEEEPNNELGSANLLNFGTPYSGAIDPAGDADFYKIHVSQPGVLTLAISNPTGSSIRSYLEMFTPDMDYAWVRSGAANAGDPVTLEWALTEPGLYYLRVSDTSGASGQYTLTANFNPVADPYEPNGDFTHAAVLQPQDNVQGYLFPAGDQDWYKVTVATPGMLKMELKNMPADIRGYIETFGRNMEYTWVRASANNDGDNVSLSFNIATPGTYFIRISDADGHANPASPYTLTTRFAPAPDRYEPNGEFRLSTLLRSSPVEAFIFPNGDEDWFRFYAKQGEKLTMTVDPVPADLRPYLELFDANGGYLWVRTNSDADGTPVVLTYDVPTDGYYRLKITDSDGHFSTAAYRLSVAGADLGYAPPDAAFDAEVEPNGTFATATRIAMGNVTGAFATADDVDLYKFEVPQRGLLTVSLAAPAGITSEIRLFNGNLSERASRYAENNGDFSQFTFAVVDPGTWYLRLHAKDGVASSENYTLNVSFAPEQDAFELIPDFAHAVPMAFGRPIQAQLFPQGDHDWFGITVEKPGIVRLTLGSLPQNMKAGLRIYNQSHDLQLERNNLNPGDPLQVDFNAVEPGIYYLEIYDRSNDTSSLSLYTLTASFTSAEDILEPDNRFSQAVLLTESNQVMGFIYPENDQDWYKFYVNKPGMLRMQVAEAEGIQPRLRLFSDSKNQLAETAAKNRGDERILSYEITKPDWYYLLVSDQGEDDFSTRPYILTIEGGQFTTSSPIAHIEGITPNPALTGDAIVFTGSGADADGTIAAYEWASSISGKLGNEGVLTLTGLPLGRHRISLRVQDHEGNWSANVYRNLYVVETMSVEAEYNDSMANANPVTLNQWINGAIYPQNDGDFYKIYVPQRGDLSTRIDAVSSDLMPYLEFWNEKGDYLWRRDGAFNPGDAIFYSFSVEPGWYFAKISDSAGRQQRKGYAVLFTFAAAPDRYEPNNAASTATWVNPDFTVADAFISLENDQDWYRVKIDQRGRFDLSLTGMPPEMRGYIELFNANIDYLWVRNGAWNDGENVYLAYDVKTPGIYYIRISDTNGRAHTLPYTLTGKFTPVPDSGEKNDALVRALLVPQNGLIEGTILPAGDENWYKIYAQADATLTIALTQVPAGMRAGIETWDRNYIYTWVREFASNDGDNVYLTYKVPTDGWYYIRVNDQNGGAYLTPYHLSITGGNPGYEPPFTPTAAEVEPNGDNGIATDIALNTTVTGKIDPADDYDWYRFYVNSAGILTVSLTNVPAGITSEMWVFNLAKEQIAYGTTTNAGENNVLVLPVTAGGYYFVRVADRDRSDTSANAYALKVTHLPVTDSHEPNDSFGAATPLGSDTVQGYIFDSQDEDWYRVYVRQAGNLSVSLDAMPAEIRPHLRLYNADRGEIGNWEATNPGQTGDGLISYYATTPGFYFVQIYDVGYDDGTGYRRHYSSGSYTLRIGGADFTHAPLLAPIGNRTIDETIPYGFTVHATDPADEQSLTYAAANLPPGATFDPASRSFNWTPARGQAGTYTGVHFTVSDGVSSDSEDITITVNELKRAPVLAPIGNKTAVVGMDLTFTVTATDPDPGAVLTYSASNLPAGAVFTPGTATFRWTPTKEQTGLHEKVKFEVTDGTWTDFAYIDIEVRLQDLKGDVNGDRVVNLADAVLAMKVVAGIADPQTIHRTADVNADGMIGMPEVIFILQYLSEQRSLVSSATLINDNFDSLNTETWWLTRGSNNDLFGEGKPYDASGVTVANGIATLSADVTDQVGVMYSKPLAITKGDILTIKRRTYVHPANREYGGTLSVYEVADPALSASKTNTFAPLFGLMYYNFDYRTDLNLFSLVSGGSLPYGPGDFSGGTAPQIAPLWNQWFDEEFVYNSGTGDTVYKINGVEEMRVQAGPLSQPYVKIMMHTYGWYTGHYIQMDYITVETKRP